MVDAPAVHTRSAEPAAFWELINLGLHAEEVEGLIAGLTVHKCGFILNRCRATDLTNLTVSTSPGKLCCLIHCRNGGIYAEGVIGLAAIYAKEKKVIGRRGSAYETSLCAG